MKSNLLSLIAGLTWVSLVGCQPPPTGFFTADVYLRPFKTELPVPLTIILDESIPDQLTVGKMDVIQFRKSLKLSLYYTFENSVSDILFLDSISSEGITLHLYRVRPTWEGIGTYSDVTVIDGTGFSTTQTEISSLIRYDGVVYKNGEKWFAIDDYVSSEQSTWRKKDQPQVFRDGVRELCEELYQKVMQPDSNASLHN